MTHWKRRVRSLIRLSGYDIVRTDSGAGPPARTMDCDIWPWLKTVAQFRTLIDIGAATGDYSAFICRYLGIERAFMFEPRPECLPLIEQNLANVNETRIFQVPLSDQVDEIEFRQTTYGPSSSALPLGVPSREEFPDIEEASRFRIRTARLDDSLADIELDSEIFVKMDVQGLEDRVIDGGPRTFSSARAVMVEMSFLPMYEGQPLFEEVHARLAAHGLRFAGLHNQIMSARTGQPLFAHCLYLRDTKAN